MSVKNPKPDRHFTYYAPAEERERKKKTTRGRRYTRVRIIIIMGRTPVKLKEVIYGISSNKVEIMGSLGRDALSAISKKIGGGWFDVTVFGIAPTVGTVMYVIVFSLIFCRVVFCCFRKGWRFGFSLSRPLFKRRTCDDEVNKDGKEKGERTRARSSCNPSLSNHKTGTR